MYCGILTALQKAHSGLRRILQSDRTTFGPKAEELASKLSDQINDALVELQRLNYMSLLMSSDESLSILIDEFRPPKTVYNRDQRLNTFPSAIDNLQTITIRFIALARKELGYDD